MKPTGSVLFMMHCQSNTGFAIEKLETVFHQAALDSGYSPERIFFSYPGVERGQPRWMEPGNSNWFEYDFSRNDAPSVARLQGYIGDHSISTVMAFDLQPDNRVLPILRRAGVRRVLSYWGAPMSPRNRGLRLLLKRLEVALRPSGPDHYIFESRAMLELATHGRGIPASKCSVIPTGVDTERFRPSDSSNGILREIGVPAGRKVFVYSGHMEPRKGVHTIVEAMDQLVARGRRDIHFLAFGNRDGEERRFFDMLTSEESHDHVTFGGYRDDIHLVFREAYAGVVASTGWDSWPMSVIEMAASGLPLLVSDLQGLKEFVVDGENGRRFTPGDADQLSRYMEEMADLPEDAARMASANREKVVRQYSREMQIRRLAELLSGPATKA